MTLTDTDRALLKRWPLFAVAAVFVYYVLAPGLTIFAMVPLIGLLALPFFFAPTLLLWYSAFLLSYFALRFLSSRIADRDIPASSIVIVAICCALGSGILISHVANRVIDRRIAEFQRQDKTARIALSPVREIALVTVSQDRHNLPRCYDFCISLLRSGTAKQVLVIAEAGNAMGIPNNFSGIRYTLKGDQQACVSPSDTWDRFFQHPHIEHAKNTGGYFQSFLERFGECISGSAVTKSNPDLVFAAAEPAPGDYNGALSVVGRDDLVFLNFDVSLPAHINGWTRAIDRRGNRELFRQTRSYCAKIVAPIFIWPITNSFDRAGSGYWVRWPCDDNSQIRDPNTLGGRAMSDWWTIVENNEEIFQKGLTAQL
jgi:hypothetical protein